MRWVAWIWVGEVDVADVGAVDGADAEADEEERLSVLREGSEEMELNFESRELETTGLPLPL